MFLCGPMVKSRMLDLFLVREKAVSTLLLAGMLDFCDESMVASVSVTLSSRLLQVNRDGEMGMGLRLRKEPNPGLSFRYIRSGPGKRIETSEPLQYNTGATEEIPRQTSDLYKLPLIIQVCMILAFGTDPPPDGAVVI